MQNKVFIKAYEAVSVAGDGTDEIFENLLDKRCLIRENPDLTVGDKTLMSGKIKDFEKATALCLAITHKDTPIFKSKNSSEALISAFEELKSGRCSEALVFASYKLEKKQIEQLQTEGKYSQSVAKPFDFETDGLNAGEAVVSVLLSTQKSDIELLDYAASEEEAAAMDTALKNAALGATDIDYIEAAAAGVPSKDRSEAAALSAVFGQGALISSSKGLTGHAFTTSALLSLVVAAKAMSEGIIPASSFLEHSFTNEISFAYANKFKQINKALVNSNEDEGKYASFVIGRA